MKNNIVSILFLLFVQISTSFAQQPAFNDSLQKNVTLPIMSNIKIKSISNEGLVENILGVKWQIPNFSNPRYAVFVITRHAEKITTGDDPDLTEAGKIRAANLAKILTKVKLAKVASTDTKRTKATAKPTADAKNLPIEIYADAVPFITNLIQVNKGKRHLVVGHSNTVPPLLNALVGVPNKFTENNQFDNLYVVVVNQMGQAVVYHYKY
jgi:phosphohistidine phosphatase SixA